MSQVSKDASEKAFQENFVRELVKNKWHVSCYLCVNFVVIFESPK